MTVLVVGATGKTGRRVVSALLRREVAVRALVRDPERLERREGLDIVGGFDFDSLATAEAALQGVERLYLVSSIDPNWPEQTIGFIDHAKKAGVRHVVRLSIEGADRTEAGFGAVASGAAHARVEAHLKDSGFDWTMLRPTWFSDNIPWQFGEDIRTRDVLHAPFGAEAKINFVDTADLAEVAAVALSEAGHEGRTYTLTGPQSHTAPEIADVLTEATGRPIGFEDMSLEEARAWMSGWGLMPSFVDTMVQVFAQARAGQTGVVTDDVPRVLGRPATPLSRTLAGLATEGAFAPAAPAD